MLLLKKISHLNLSSAVINRDRGAFLIISANSPPMWMLLFVTHACCAASARHQCRRKLSVVLHSDVFFHATGLIVYIQMDVLLGFTSKKI